MSRLLITLFVASALAQTPAPSSFPANWYGAGAAFNTSPPAGQSPASGWAAYAHLLSTPAGTYSFSVYNAYVARSTAGHYQLVTSTATGVMLVVRQMGLATLLAFGAAGVASGATIGNSFPFGGLLDFHLGKTLWHLDAGIEEIPSSVAGAATQKSALVGFGRTF